MQFAPAARLVPQLLANTKEEALLPVTAMLVIVSAAVPVLVTVTDWEALACPTTTLPNDRLVAESETVGLELVPPVNVKSVDVQKTPPRSEYTRTYTVPLVGIPVTACDVAVIWAVLAKMFEEPTPVLPTYTQYAVAPVAAVQLNVTLEPLSVPPGAGDVMTASGVLNPIAFRITNSD